MAKGVSIEDKRKRMLEIFHESKDVYQLKDLEKLAPKTKGILANTVKDVLQSLVDDGLVQSEKIGISVYFWSFPHAILQTTQRELDEYKAKIESLEMRISDLKPAIEQAESVRLNSDQRSELISQSQTLQSSIEQVTAELDAYRHCDPQIYQVAQSHVEMCKEAVNRWTDNVFAMLGYLTKTFSLDTSQVLDSFSIPSDLDYV